MKLLISLLVLIPLTAAAQPNRPGSLLNRLPYVPEPRDDVPVPMLNPASALQSLEPLPDFDLPPQLPPEFIADPVQRQIFDWFSRASALLGEDKPEEAVALLARAVEAQPDVANLRVSLADSLYAAGRYREAVSEYEAVLETAPFHFQCLNNLGWLLSTVNDPEIRDPQRGLELAQRARLIRPDSHHMWSTLSQSYYDLGQYRQAEACIVNALRLARQTGVRTPVVVNYLFHRDRCVLAREATSILEE